MNIQGLQKTTLLDYPGHVAATIFLGGCNFRCPFCHNMNIVNMNQEERLFVDDILVFLKKRAGVLEGVCITGGEPTIYDDLPDFIKLVKSLGLKVKLDTNGTNPGLIKALIDEKLIDYIAMDIKSSLDQYDVITGVDMSCVNSIKATIDIIKNSCLNYEFRTTFIREYHTKDVINKMASLLKGSSSYYIQSFKDSEYVPNHQLNAFTYEELLDIKRIFEETVNNVEIRGIDS